MWLILTVKKNWTFIQSIAASNISSLIKEFHAIHKTKLSEVKVEIFDDKKIWHLKATRSKENFVSENINEC